MTRLEAANDRSYAALVASLRLMTLAIGTALLAQQGTAEDAVTSLALLSIVAVAATLGNFLYP